MKAFYAGLVIVGLAVAVALVLDDSTYIYKITGIAGVICLGLAGVVSGAFASGSQVGRNVHSETKQTREERYQLMFFR
ncbi:DUF5316 family protein [Sediminibacillus albus]|uniref:Uncharacterized protein n=1 Tax=Sediminibacillus albus TaxID=407036 RepID=A0A1G8WUP8_9BACI|nr:DUF5316 family protein [Sediminibacillus albus]SDJ81766.1 hypothetical protein SAMN05216243_0998 [Sediminibacillus albus]